MLAVALSILATLFFLGLLFVILAISVYNQLNESLCRCENAYAQLNVHSKRRYELIPPLMDKLRDVPGIDPTIFQATTSTCQTAQVVDQGADGGLKDREAFARSKDAEAELDSATRQLGLSLETLAIPSPDCRYASLTMGLSSTEARISFARTAYDEFAAQYNAIRTRFPARLFANKLGFGEVPQFGIANRKQTLPTGDVQP